MEEIELSVTSSEYTVLPGKGAGLNRRGSEQLKRAICDPRREISTSNFDVGRAAEIKVVKAGDGKVAGYLEAISKLAVLQRCRFRSRPGWWY